MSTTCGWRMLDLVSYFFRDKFFFFAFVAGNFSYEFLPPMNTSFITSQDRVIKSDLDFYILVINEREFLRNLYVSGPPEWEKRFLRKGLSIVCRRYRHDNFQKNDRIGLLFGTPLEGRIRNDKSVNQPLLINGSGFIYQKRFSKNQKFNFPAKIYEIRKKC